MTEHPKDITKASGMCPHGNFPDACPACKSSKLLQDTRAFAESFKPENRLARYVSEAGEIETKMLRERYPKEAVAQFFGMHSQIDRIVAEYSGENPTEESSHYLLGVGRAIHCLVDELLKKRSGEGGPPFMPSPEHTHDHKKIAQSPDQFQREILQGLKNITKIGTGPTTGGLHVVEERRDAVGVLRESAGVFKELSQKRHSQEVAQTFADMHEMINLLNDVGRTRISISDRKIEIQFIAEMNKALVVLAYMLSRATTYGVSARGHRIIAGNPDRLRKELMRALYRTIKGVTS